MADKRELGMNLSAA